VPAYNRWRLSTAALSTLCPKRINLAKKGAAPKLPS